MAIAVFDAALFKARYPEFAAVNNTLLASYFTEAGFYLDNTDGSIVSDVSRRLVLLDILTAHIGKLSGILNPDGQPEPVGRIASATQGSVSASFDFAVPGTAAWFAQTQYGAAFWQATINYRSMLYFPKPVIV